MSQRTILVTGATGRQGGAVIDALLSDPQGSPFKIYGLTRDKNSPAALRVAERGVEMISGNVADPAPIFANLTNAFDAIFSVTFSSGGEEEEQEAKALIDTALENKVHHFVFASVDRGGPAKFHIDPTNVPHFQSKFNIEKYLLRRTEEVTSHHMRWTILRPVTFMDMFRPGMLSSVMGRIVYNAADVHLQFISVRDIGKVAADVLYNAEQFYGKALTLSAGRLNFAGIDRAFQEVVGIDMPFAPNASYPSQDTNKMVAWMEKGGYDYEYDEENKTKFGLMDFKTRLKDLSGWANERSKGETLST